MRTRKDAWKIPATDQTLVWYAKAIAEMKKRPITDPTSWRYQAAVHDYVSGDDPLATHGEALPTPSDQQTFWARCQHGSWFFLPWHRAYLFYFEHILRQIIQKLGGPSDWALPYWNYSDPSNSSARCLPPLFWAPKLPDGTANPLLVSERVNGANSGHQIGTPADAENSTCLGKPLFINNSTGGATGFGGGRTGFSHAGGVTGGCEAVPHNTMHGAVGGPTGWMSAFNTAPLDPIFWLHHANLDRLWVVWLKGNSKHVNPTMAAWLTAVRFGFHDAGGSVVSITPSQVLDTRDALLDYMYEDESDPLHTAGPAVAPLAARTTMEIQRIPEMVGATDTQQAITLGQESSSVQFALQAPTGPALTLDAADSTVPREVHLNIENITATGRPIESYEVYVNVPDGDTPENHPELMAGLIPRFGIFEASRPTLEHAGDGLNYAFDITAVVAGLQKLGKWDPSNIRITFVPHRSEAERTAATSTLPIRIGRVSLYFA